MFSSGNILIWVVIVITTATAVASTVSTRSGSRTKRQAWMSGNWASFLPTPITYEPEILSRLSDESCNCIEGNLCPEFLKMLPHRTRLADQLQRVTCGFRGFQPLVCCNQICEHTFLQPSPTPYHAPGVYYNIPDDRTQADDPYMQATSERNYYSKRFSHDSAFPHNENGFVTPRTYTVYPDYIVKTHDISTQMYPEMRHKPYYTHWGSNSDGNNPSHNYYPKYPLHPIINHHKSDSNAGSGYLPDKINVPDHHQPKYPFDPMLDPHQDNSNDNFPKKINSTLDSLPEHPFHPMLNPHQIEPSHDNSHFPNKINSSDHNIPEHPLHPILNHHTNEKRLNNSSFPNVVNSSDDTFSTSTISNNNSVNVSNTKPTSGEGMLDSTDDRWTLTAKRKEKRKLLPTVECGVASGERILGGKSAVLGEYPWIARIGYTRNSSGSDVLLFRCAGSLINSCYVVTAAHCVTNLPAGLQLATVRLGELDERTDPDCSQLECADPVQDFLPVDVRVHEQYNSPRFRNDIALIRLDRPVTFTNYISPICLPFDTLSTKSYVGLKSDTAGWGATDLGATSSSPVLQWVRVTVMPNEECAQVFADRTGTRLGPGQICAGGERGRDSCEGDSGGPLMREEQLGPEDFTRYYMLGLVSFGAKRCGSENLPGVYTDIPKYLDWILDNIEP